MIKPIFITTFFLLFIGGVLFFYNDQNKSTNYQNTSQGKQKLLEKLDTKELNSINILSDGSYVSLIQLKGGVWEEKSMKYQADITSIQDLLLTITQIKLGDLVTNNAEHHERFKLLEPPEIVADLNKDFHGNSISLLRGNGTIILSLILGKERKNGEGQYVRHSGSSNVFLISEKISIKSEVQDWLNKDLMALNPKQVSGLKIKFGEKHSISIIRGTNESKWESAIPKNNVPKNERINNALDRLSSLSFSKLLNQDYVTEELLESKEDTLIVSLFDGRVYTLKLQKYLQSNENYVLSLRMGILQDVSENTPSDSSDLHKDMKTFNQKMNGRFFEISSWEGKELILSDE